MSRAAMQQALEALDLCRLNGSQYLYGNERDTVFSAIAALRAALAEPELGPGWCPIHQHYKPCEHNTSLAEQAQVLDSPAPVGLPAGEQTGPVAGGSTRAEQAQPVATLHDDGCFTWKCDEFRRRYDRQRAGWRMDVYTTPPAPVAPPGWRMVPVEPTEDMRDAGDIERDMQDARHEDGCGPIYRAMLAAAPEAPAPVVPQPLSGWEMARVIADADADELAAVSGTVLLRLIRAVEAAVLERMGTRQVAVK